MSYYSRKAQQVKKQTNQNKQTNKQKQPLPQIAMFQYFSIFITKVVEI